MLGLLETKSVQTSILAGVLFYLFANPSTFKMVKKIPGLKFVMKSATEITHSGVVVHSLLFGAVLFVCVWLINRSLFLKHYLNVVEGYKEHGDGMDGHKDHDGVESDYKKGSHKKDHDAAENEALDKATEYGGQDDQDDQDDQDVDLSGQSGSN